MKYLIIGGVAGGATAAARIRRNTEKAEIVMLEKGPHISYANCGLPYYVGGVISDRNSLFVQTPEAFGKRFNIDVRTGSEALEVDPARKVVKVRGKDGKTYEEGYDKLLLSPGASAVVPPLEGIGSKGIFTMRNVTDTDMIKEYVTSGKVRRAVVVGAGFIGLEMAENLVHAGIGVDVVEMADQVMGPLDFSMAAMLNQHLTDKGVGLYLGEAVESFSEDAGTLSVNLRSGKVLKAEMVILSIGVRPNTELAAGAGLEVGRGIKVNEFMQTSDKDIYAVGDAVEFRHPLTGEPWMNFLAGPANRQARIVADNMVFGNSVSYEGSVGTSVAKVFDMTAASTGLAAKKLRQMGIPYLSATIHSGSHAGYYPGALQMDIKVVFSPEDGRLYGAQITGYDGVDKRIDELAMVVKNGGTVYDLTRIEHAYAPPFSSAKDPVAVAGYVAGNILSGKMTPLYWRELRDMDLSKVTLVDVRTRDEYELGNIKGSVNIPLDDMRERLGEIPSDRPVVLYCGIGLRGYLASNILKDNGFKDVRNLIGGIRTYKAAVTKPCPPTEDGDSCRREAEKACPCPQPDAAESQASLKLDACGLQCPGPVLRLKSAVQSLKDGELLEIKATDAGFPRDARSWCLSTGNTFVSASSAAGIHTVLVRKGSADSPAPSAPAAADGKTFILFSDDLDKALATFVLANGAAATGKKVTIFFTFWGLNAIKKVHKPRVHKDLIGRMFGAMLPSSSLKLKLSKMNMLGIGSRMMRSIMKNKGIDSLESLRDQAIAAGVEFIACQMSMDVMGVKRKELLDNVTVGGVATYMQRAEAAGVNLFI